MRQAENSERRRGFLPLRFALRLYVRRRPRQGCAPPRFHAGPPPHEDVFHRESEGEENKDATRFSLTATDLLMEGCAERQCAQNQKPMRVVILSGTQFEGRRA